MLYGNKSSLTLAHFKRMKNIFFFFFNFSIWSLSCQKADCFVMLLIKVCCHCTRIEEATKSKQTEIWTKVIVKMHFSIRFICFWFFSFVSSFGEGFYLLFLLCSQLQIKYEINTMFYYIVTPVWSSIWPIKCNDIRSVE